MYLKNDAAALRSEKAGLKIEIQKGFHMDLIRIILFLVSMTFVVIALTAGYFIGAGILKLDAVIAIFVLGFLLYLALSYYCNRAFENLDSCQDI